MASKINIQLLNDNYKKNLESAEIYKGSKQMEYEKFKKDKESFDQKINEEAKLFVETQCVNLNCKEIYSHAIKNRCYFEKKRSRKDLINTYISYYASFLKITKHNEKTGNICMICYTSDLANNDVLTYCCKKSLCIDCSEELYKRQHKYCPNCRSELYDFIPN